MMSMTPSRARRGQSLVEFALVLPLLLVLMLGILDFGRAVFAYNSVSNAARSGARVAIVNQDYDAVEAAVLKEAVGLDPIDVEPLTYPGDGENICPVRDCVVRVEVTHEWEAATPIISQIVGPLSISAASELPIERKRP